MSDAPTGLGEARVAGAPPEGNPGILPIGFIFGDDFLVHHVNVDPEATVRDICTTAADYVSGIRVPDEGRDLRLIFKGEEQPLDALARDVGIGWLDYVEIKVSR
ncbi:toluene-4-monooxygenase system B family protein [Capillimicrobium parvum]|uniref:Toluene monooxygenase n=1 Tax=Capillimicrobium parvum TaxID=2884022 RepID=A0A9E6XZF2_9ACTN|nr:toluene-4-monooxygenase system B family protein [Capillimicrobium parvum]UGS37219.1 hypothetical protein DSM104329_03634 [Capillimicrobium parvum]